MNVVDAPCVWLTTVRVDGSPHTTPVWFVFRDGTFWLASAAGNAKVRNLEQDPRASLAVDGSAMEPGVAEGTALIHRQVRERPDVLGALADKYAGWDAADESQDGPRVLIEIPVGRWLLGSSSIGP